MTLTEKYCSLLALEKNSADNTETDYSLELDALYEEIVNRPIYTILDAKDKLSFALHCLGEVGDYVEAERLLIQVNQAMDRLSTSFNLKKRRLIKKERLSSFSDEKETSLPVLQDNGRLLSHPIDR